MVNMKAAVVALFCGSAVSAFSPVTPISRTTTTSTQLNARQSDAMEQLANAGKAVTAAALSFALVFGSTDAAFADGQTKEFKFPPIDFSDKSRCQFSGSKMGQANAQRDKLYDLRQCNLSGKDASGFDLSGVIMTKTDVSGAKFVESQFSKAFLHDSNFDGADFTNGIIDRASFKGSSLKGSIFTNAVLTGTSFEDADVENADFSDAYIGDFDIRNLCKNPTLKGENPVTGIETKASAGCLGLRR